MMKKHSADIWVLCGAAEDGRVSCGLVTEIGRCVAVIWQQRNRIKLNTNKSRCCQYEEGVVSVASQQQIDEETKEKVVFYCLNEG